MASSKETLRDIEGVQRGMERVVQKLTELRARQVSTQKMRAVSQEEAAATLAAQNTKVEAAEVESGDPPPFRPSRAPQSSTYSHVAPDRGRTVKRDR